MNNSHLDKESIDNVIISKLLSHIKELITKYSIINDKKDNKDFYLILEEKLNKFKEEETKIKLNEEKSFINNNNLNNYKNNNIIKEEKSQINKIKIINNNITKQIYITNCPEKDSRNLKINNLRYINKDEDKNINIRLDYLPKLNENTKNKLSFDNLYLYNKLINLLYHEFKSLNIKINISNSRNCLNNNLNSINDNINQSLIIDKDIINIKFKLDKIKNDCNIVFNNIYYGIYNSKDINKKFKILIENIEKL